MMKKEGFPDTHHDVSSNAIFGFWLYLMTDCVMFATFFAAYAVLQPGTFGGPNAHDLFSLPFVLIETMILLASSFTCGLAMVHCGQSNSHNSTGRSMGASRHRIQFILFWFGATFLLGVAFMGMELYEFNSLIKEGHTWQKSAFLSSYFTLIGTHGLHLVVGLIFMIVYLSQLVCRGLTSAVLRRLTCLRVYWQFLYLIWIFTFTFVYLIGAK